METTPQNPFAWVEIYVKDMNRAKLFYETVFAMTLTEMQMPGEETGLMLCFAFNEQSYGASGALVQMEGFEPGVGGTLVYFSSKDCITEESRVVAAGGQIVKPKMSIDTHGFISIIMDTEGNMIGLHSMG